MTITLREHAEEAMKASKKALQEDMFIPMLFTLQDDNIGSLPMLIESVLWNRFIQYSVEHLGSRAVILAYTSYCQRMPLTEKPLEKITWKKAKEMMDKLGDKKRHNTLLVLCKSPMEEFSLIQEYKVTKKGIVFGKSYDDSEAMLVSTFMEGIYEKQEVLN